jgi:carboxymethylenebutenolidase
MAGTMVTFPANGTTTSGYLATPKSGTGPGVLVLQEWWGLVPHIKHVADRFAAEGFVALAPDMYHGKTASEPDDAGKLFMALNIAQAEKDLRGAATYLLAHSSTKTIGVVGFCMGGGFALLLAPNGGFDASSVNYGTTRRDVVSERYLAGACPIVGSYGAKDPANRGTAQRLEAVLTSLGVPHDIKEYAGAGHGFIADHDLEDIPFALRILSWTSGPEHHVPSALDAKRRIISFFDEHLKRGD